jgi:hypothetical protein
MRFLVLFISFLFSAVTAQASTYTFDVFIKKNG